MPITPPSSHWAAVTSCLDSTQRQIFNVVKFKGIHKYAWKYEYYGGKDATTNPVRKFNIGFVNHGVDGRGDVKSSPPSSRWLSFTSFFVVSLRSQVETQQIQGKFPQKADLPNKAVLFKKCVSKLYAPVLQQIFWWSKTKFDLKTLTFLKEARWKSMNLAIDVQYSTSKWIPSKGLPTLSKLLKVLPKNSRKSNQHPKNTPPKKSNKHKSLKRTSPSLYAPRVGPWKIDSNSAKSARAYGHLMSSYHP